MNVLLSHTNPISIFPGKREDFNEALCVFAYDYEVDRFVLPYSLDGTDIGIESHLFTEFNNGRRISFNFMARRTYGPEKCAIYRIAEGVDRCLWQCVSRLKEIVEACIQMLECGFDSRQCL